MLKEETCLALSTVGCHNTMSLICCELSAACSKMWVYKTSELKTRLRYNDEYGEMRVICHLPSSEQKAKKSVAMFVFERVLDNDGDMSLKFLFFFPSFIHPFPVQGSQPEISSG